jgi:uncharacterized membrane protein
MFSIKSALRYAWDKFKTTAQLSLAWTLMLLAVSSMPGSKKGPVAIFFAIAITILIIIIRIGYTKVFLRMYDNEMPKFTDIFKEYKYFWNYLGVSILAPLAILGGLILLIIPGIIWAVRFSLAPVIVIDNQIGPIAAMKESYALTKGMFWKLLLFWLTIGLVNLAGFVALVVGLLVSVPVSTLATIYVYRELSKAKASISTTPMDAPMVV